MWLEAIGLIAGAASKPAMPSSSSTGQVNFGSTVSAGNSGGGEWMTAAAVVAVGLLIVVVLKKAK